MKKIESFATKIILAFSVLILVFIYLEGIKTSYFHQDDIVELGNMVRYWPEAILWPNNEHFNITFNLLLRLQWNVFGINYPGYLAISLLLHVGILILVKKIVQELSHSRFLAYASMGLLVINRNWNEVIWWTTGQMIELMVLFSLLSYWLLIKSEKTQKNKAYLEILLGAVSILPSLSWGIGLIWPLLLIVVYGWRYDQGKIKLKHLSLWISLMVVMFIYLKLGLKNINHNFELGTWFQSPLKILTFITVGISNSMVGRLLWPFKNNLIRIIILASALIILVKNKLISKQFIWNKPAIFGLVVVIASYGICALARWKFGIGQAMAERYVYQPLIFGTIALFSSLKISKLRLLDKTKITLLILVLMALNLGGFLQKTSQWTIRPQQTKKLFLTLNQTKENDCLTNNHLPDFIIENSRWDLKYIWPMFKKDFDPFKNECN